MPRTKKVEADFDEVEEVGTPVKGAKASPDEEAFKEFQKTKYDGTYQVVTLPSGSKVIMGPQGQQVSPIFTKDQAEEIRRITVDANRHNQANTEIRTLIRNRRARG